MSSGPGPQSPPATSPFRPLESRMPLARTPRHPTAACWNETTRRSIAGSLGKCMVNHISCFQIGCRWTPPAALTYFHFSGCVGTSHYSFTWRPPDGSWCCLSWMSSSTKSLDPLPILKIRLFIFLLDIFRSSIHILDFCTINIFSYSITYLFIFLMVSWHADSSYFNEVYCIRIFCFALWLVFVFCMT